MMRFIFVMAASLIVFPAWGHAQEKGRKPNIIVILADDLGYADLSMQGSKDIKTPHIDKLRVRLRPRRKRPPFSAELTARASAGAVRWTARKCEPPASDRPSSRAR